MENRKKKGIASIVSGVVFIVFGAILIATTETPDWVPVGLQLLGAVGSILGFVFVFPDTD